MYDKDKIKNGLTLHQVAEVIEALGGSAPRIYGGMFMAETICHNTPGEGSFELYYYDNTKLFKCYTGCHEYFDVFQLVQKANDVQYGDEWSLPKAVSYIGQMFGFETIQADGFQEILLEDWTFMKLFEKEQEKRKEYKETILKEYDGTILEKMYHPIIKPWIDEGILQRTIDKYEISYYPNECQIVIPHRDAGGRLVGVRGRTLVKEDGELYGKYRPIRINSIMYNHPLGFALYGLNHAKENIKSVKKAIIFEGEKSVMLYDSMFGSENNIAVACCGSSISIHQFELLRELGVQEIIIAFDRQFMEIGDADFKVHVKNLQQLANKFKNYTTVSCMFDKEKDLGYKSSPIDHGKDTFIKLFQNRITL